jgi:hypothetical protein
MWGIILAALFALLGLLCLGLGARVLRRRRLGATAAQFAAAAVLLTAGALLGVLALATQGYHGLTREKVAAVIRIEPTGPQAFEATVVRSDGREDRFRLVGDEVYVDAHILKWKPIANVLGLHTAYELDRVAGRYRSLEDEQHKARTVYSLSDAKMLNIFDLRRRYQLLAPLLDVEYGSATFVPADRRSVLEVRISTTGLLIREEASAKRS